MNVEWVRTALAMRCLRYGFALGLLLLNLAPARADVMLHAFNWPYDEVAAQADAIQAAGFRMVLVAPAYRSEGAAWWARYQPQDYRLIDHPLGNTERFANMVQVLQARGIRVYADIVFNHMANEAAQRSDLNYPGAAVLAEYASQRSHYDAQTLFGDIGQNFLSVHDFGPAQCIGNYQDVWQVQHWRLCGGGGDPGLPDLLGNDWVVAQQQAYLRALKALGVKGFRVDAAKHMPFEHINRVFSADIMAGVHVFGEVITGGGAGESEYEAFLAPYLQHTGHGAYDFPLLNTLRGALGFGGSLTALIDPLANGQALQPSRAITMAVTHDIPNNAGFRYLIMDPVDETLAYAYLLGRDGGVPLLYSDHNESGDGRWIDAWQRSDLQGMLRFHNAVQGNDMQVLAAGDCYLLFRRGSRGIVGINKCGTALQVAVDMNNSVLWWYSKYVDTLGGGSLTIRSATHTFNLPPRSAQMWLR